MHEWHGRFNDGDLLRVSLRRHMHMHSQIGVGAIADKQMQIVGRPTHPRAMQAMMEERKLAAWPQVRSILQGVHV